jgi:triphosphoribosyl-dephospho-CoA synthase
MWLEAVDIARAAQTACVLEVSAEKPGNVTRYEDFWDTGLSHFVVSAVAVGPAFLDASRAPVGETILRAVRDTQRLVNTNTNLGIVLLLAPLAKAAGLNHPEGLHAGIRQVLNEVTVEDAKLAYEAIRIARPGGLGKLDRYDVRGEPQVDITLREAMGLAQSRDAVAREYVTDFEITFEIGYPTLHQLSQAGHRFSDIIVQTSLTILSQVPDTLIARKKGADVAKEVSRRAQQVLKMGGMLSEQSRREVRRFDQSLRDKKHSLNPGTTADLTTASLFVFLTEGGALARLPDLLRQW